MVLKLLVKVSITKHKFAFFVFQVQVVSTFDVLVKVVRSDFVPVFNVVLSEQDHHHSYV